MRRGRIATVVLTALLALGGSVVQAPPSSACLVPCNVSPKAMGVILGGGIPSDYFGFHINGQFSGFNGLKTVKQNVDIYGGGYYPAYGSVVLNGQPYSASVSMQVIPGLSGLPSLALVSIARGPGSSNEISGYMLGVLGGAKSYGELQINQG